jgi:hypothetical protein
LDGSRIRIKGVYLDDLGHRDKGFKGPKLQKKKSSSLELGPFLLFRNQTVDLFLFFFHLFGHIF